MINNIEEIKPLLIQQFSALSTLKEKFEFWEKNLGIRFPSYQMQISSYNMRIQNPDLPRIMQLVDDFKIRATSREENLELNNYCLEYYRRIDIAGGRRKLYDIEILTKQFKEGIEKVKNKSEYIKHELSKLDDLVYLHSHRNDQDPFTNGYKFFEFSYTQHYFNDIPVDLSESAYDIYDTVALLNGQTLSEFRKYLESVNVKSIKSGKIKKERIEITAKQQLLILQYLGVFDKIDFVENKLKSSKFLGLLLNKNSQNIREIFTYDTYELVKTKDDLCVVKELFEHIGAKSLLKMIDDDLSKL